MPTPQARQPPPLRPLSAPRSWSANLTAANAWALRLLRFWLNLSEIMLGPLPFVSRLSPRLMKPSAAPALSLPTGSRQAPSNQPPIANPPQHPHPPNAGPRLAAVVPAKFGIQSSGPNAPQYPPKCTPPRVRSFLEKTPIRAHDPCGAPQETLRRQALPLPGRPSTSRCESPLALYPPRPTRQPSPGWIA